ncbi:MAG: hypothetical protein HQ456_03525 [Polynucleobacter sp.]|nr:hypothetical protein [Polynucleobacter sp.]
MVGRPKIRIPKTKDGYIARATIVNELTKHLDESGTPLASSKSRAAISDFKSHLARNGLSHLILNTGTTGKELYPTQELGMWLYNRKKPYRGFTTPICPFLAPIIVSSNNLDAHFLIGQAVATGAGTYEELLEEMRVITASLVEKDMQLQLAHQVIRMYKAIDQKISARNSKSAKKKRPRK